MEKAPLILIVDDEQHIVHVLSVKLVQAGFRVACEPDGYSALQFLSHDAPDLVIAADHIPGMDGRQFSDALSQNSATAHLPVLLLSAHRRSISSDDTYTENIRAVIGKPFRPSDVINQVATILDPTAPLEAA